MDKFRIKRKKKVVLVRLRLTFDQIFSRIYNAIMRIKSISSDFCKILYFEGYVLGSSSSKRGGNRNNLVSHLNGVQSSAYRK